MRHFDLDHSRCACCDKQHVNASGDKMLCDRQMIRECISIWFGNQAAFEDYIRSEVVEELAKGLEYGVFTRSWSLVVTLPFFWVMCDMGAAWISAGDYDAAFALLIEGFVLWGLAIPTFVDWFVLLPTRRFCRRARTMTLDILKSWGVFCLLMAGYLFMWGVYVLAQLFFVWTPLRRAGVVAGFWCLAALFHFCVNLKVQISF